MSYSHMFYGVDLDKLKAIYGSKDENFLAEVLKAQAQAIKDNDEWFKDEIQDEGFPPTKQALREIVLGTFGTYEGAEAMYGYALKIICGHIGHRVGADDVANVADHPYESQLVASGPPIPIPYDESDFPEIGFLPLAQIPEEFNRIDNAPGKARRSVISAGLSLLTGGRAGHRMKAEDLAQDMAAYRRTLTEALEKKLAVISFRH
jgi:hypothetical protein